MSASTKSLEERSRAAAAEVLRARSALGTICRYDGSAEGIAAARQALRDAKAERMRADADLIASGLPIPRDRVLVVADGDPQVRPRPETHRALELAHSAACDEFLKVHPLSFDPDDAPWPRATRRAYDALLKANRAAHVALGCPADAPCRVDAR